MIHGVAGTPDACCAEVAGHRSRTSSARENSRDVLYQAVASADGDRCRLRQFRGWVSPGGDADRCRPPPVRCQRSRPISQLAFELTSTISPAGESRRRHRTFFDTWGHVVGRVRRRQHVGRRGRLPGYAAAKLVGEAGCDRSRRSTPTPDIRSSTPECADHPRRHVHRLCDRESDVRRAVAVSIRSSGQPEQQDDHCRSERRQDRGGVRAENRLSG